MVKEITRNLKIRYYRLRIFCIRKKIDKLNELADSEIEYHTISICICKKILAEWREYCKTKAKVISINILTTMALMEMMHITVDELK